MARKKWTPKDEVTPELIRFREKRKWQISLRRYVLNGLPCTEYAPYFGLDIKSMRKWFESQFEGELNWDNFAKNWQFEHVIPVTRFDFGKDEDLRLCWNFTNIRVENVETSKSKGPGLDILVAKKYFRDLYEHTGYALCMDLLHKIDQIEQEERVSTARQQAFISSHLPYLEMIAEFGPYEFEQLNAGRSAEEIKKEADFLKNIKNHP